MNVEPWTTVGQGDEGPVVTGIQYLLRARGFTVTADGVFGPQTRAKVIDLQTTDGLPADGIVGPVTWPKLVMQTGPGASGDAVRAVQQFGLLRSPGDTALAVDGEYGPKTRQAVRRFQRENDLRVTGEVDDRTWDALRRYRRRTG